MLFRTANLKQKDIKNKKDTDIISVFLKEQ